MVALTCENLCSKQVMFVQHFFLFATIKCNIYFPVLKPNYAYVGFSLQQYPTSYVPWWYDESRVVQIYFNDSKLYFVVGFSPNPTHACVITRLSTDLLDQRCSLGIDTLKIDENLILLTLECLKYTFVLLIQSVPDCRNFNDFNEFGTMQILLVYPNLKKTKIISLASYKFEANTLVVGWIHGENRISILNYVSTQEVKNFAFNWININWNGVSTKKRILDIKLYLNNLLISMSDGCLYTCGVPNCTIKLIQIWKCRSEEVHDVGTLQISYTGSHILHLRQYSEGVPARYGLSEIPTYNIELNVLKTYTKINEKTEYIQCGSISISDIVLIDSRTISRSINNPCRLDPQGVLLACLILGEPYIFDISDCNSAHPISSFSESALDSESSIVHFGFLNQNTFFIERTNNSEDNDPRKSIGYIYDVTRELQPTLIASHIVYPTFTSSIVAAYSYILVNQITKDIYYFSQSGRIFYSHASRDKFEIQLIPRQELGFYISDILASRKDNITQSVNNIYHFDHPIAFFSAAFSKLVYIYYYRSDSSTLIASSITIAHIDSNNTILRSVIKLGEYSRLIQASIDSRERYLFLVYKSLAEKYFDLRIIFIENLPEYSFDTDHVTTQVEIKGEWIDTKDNDGYTKSFWIISFDKDSNFSIISHNITNNSSTIYKYSISSNLSIHESSNIEIPCRIINNLNDNINNLTFVLCSRDGIQSIKYVVYLIDLYENSKIICTHTILNPKYVSTNNTFRRETNYFPSIEYDPIVHRLLVSAGNELYCYSTTTCPFTFLYLYKNLHPISSLGSLTISFKQKTFTVALLSFLQRVDVISDCTAGYGVVENTDPNGQFCVRCSPGKFGLGCQICPSGFYCHGYSQLQPSGPCPEGYYCLEGTSSGPGELSNATNPNTVQNYPTLCPEGSYCPAGTSTYLKDDLKHNNPKLCYDGYYCPAGSVKPTQKACPQNSISIAGSKSLNDCYCKPGFYGDMQNSKKCLSCLRHTICDGTHKNKTLKFSQMVIPLGYWPNTPENASEVLKCETTLAGQSPCMGGYCTLICSNSTHINATSCRTTCTDVCLSGQEDRLCSKCIDYYYKHSSSMCKPCRIKPHEIVIFSFMVIICIILLIWYYLRQRHKTKKNNEVRILDRVKKPTLFSDDFILEIFLSFTLIVAGLASASSLLLLLFTVFIVYVEKIKSPAYTKNIFIFYIQTLQALTSSKFTWPESVNNVFWIFDAVYSPLPGLSCLPNIFTNKNLGWHGKNYLFFFFPILLFILICLVMFLHFKTYGIILVQPAMSFLMLITILQFPLGSLSLSMLACVYDENSSKYYLVSEPWVECKYDNPLQICGFIGVCVYLFGIPLILHYWYWRSEYLQSIKAELCEIIFPCGTKNDTVFLTFITGRSIVLAMVITIIPRDWNLTNFIVFLVLGSNTVIVLIRKPYCNDEKIQEMSLSGELLEVACIFIILLSVLLLDIQSKHINNHLKSMFVAVANFLFTFFYVFGVIFIDRIQRCK